MGMWNDGDMQTGHYEHGDYPGTWLNEKNLHTQCSQCNTYMGGNRNVYAIRLEARYGYGILQELARRLPPLTWTRSMLVEIYTKTYNRTHEGQ